MENFYIPDSYYDLYKYTIIRSMRNEEKRNKRYGFRGMGFVWFLIVPYGFKRLSLNAVLGENLFNSLYCGRDIRAGRVFRSLGKYFEQASFRSNNRHYLSWRNNNRFSPIYYIYLYIYISPLNHTHEIHQTISSARPRATHNEPVGDYSPILSNHEPVYITG